MFETTQDIFYLVLSIGIGIISILLAVLLGYFIAIVRRVNNTFKEISNTIDKIKLIVETGLGNFGLVGEGMKWLAKSFFGKKKSTSSSTTRKRKTKTKK